MKNINFKNNVHKGYEEIIPKDKNNENTKEFKNINLIYGNNGSGKSTFSDYLRTNYNAFIFDRNYIENNILLEDNKSFKGIKLIGGNNQVTTSKTIKKEKEVLRHKQEERNKLLEELQNNESEIGKLIFEINRENKNGTRINNISDYETAQKIMKSNINKNGTLRLDYQKYDLKNFQVFQEENKFKKYKNINIEISEKIIEILKTSFSDKQYDYTDYRWMEKGMNLLVEDKCAFCGNKVSEEKVKEINEYIKNETNIAKNKLKKFKNEITQLRNFDFSNQNLNNKFLKSEIANTMTNLENNNIFDILDNLNKFIDRKINDMSLISNEFNELNDYIQNFKKEIDNNNKILIDEEEKLIKESNRVNEIIKLNIAKLIIDNDLLKDKRKKNDEIIQKGLNKKKEIEELKIKIKELKDKMSSIKSFVDFFNHKTNQLDYHFFLKIEDNNYILKSKLVENIELEKLSEGERFMFAFLYFYFEHMLEYRENKKLLVIDDPFTSLDNENKYYIEGLILSFIKNNRENFQANEDKQLFILTHHYSFFIDLCESMHGKDKALSLYLENNNGKKEMYTIDSKMKEYRLMYNKIIEFNSNPSESESISIGNMIRRCVESFCKFNFNINNVSDGDIYFKVLFEEYKEREEVYAFLKFINNSSHSTSDESSYKNVKKYAKIFEELFTNKYPTHHLAMIEKV